MKPQRFGKKTKQKCHIELHLKKQKKKYFGLSSPALFRNQWNVIVRHIEQ